MDLFDRFLQERTCLKGVAPETLRYYRWAGRAFQPILANPSKQGMLDCIQRLLADGVSPTSVNTYLRGFKAYVRWLHAEGHLEGGFQVEFLKTESKVRIPPKVSADSEGNANGIPGRRRTVHGAQRRWLLDCARSVRLRQEKPIRSEAKVGCR